MLVWLCFIIHLREWFHFLIICFWMILLHHFELLRILFHHCASLIMLFHHFSLLMILFHHYFDVSRDHILQRVCSLSLLPSGNPVWGQFIWGSTACTLEWLAIKRGCPWCGVTCIAFEIPSLVAYRCDMLYFPLKNKIMQFSVKTFHYSIKWCYIF